MTTQFELTAINPQNEWYLYKGRYPIAEIDRHLINALSRKSAAAFWREVIARRWKPLPRFLPATHWSNQPVAYGPNWYMQWNEPVEPDPVVEFLRTSLSWMDDKLVFVIMDGDTVFSTNWGIFLKYWQAFLFNNEDAIIINSKNASFVRFVDTGVLFIGRREPNSAIDTIHI